jgi:hypothetical protein
MIVTPSQALELVLSYGIEVNCLSTTISTYIGNNPSLHLHHPGVSKGSDGSDGTSYHLKDNYTLLGTEATFRIASLPPLLCTWFTQHQNDTCVTLLIGAAVILLPFKQHMATFMPIFGRQQHFTPPILLYIGCHTRPIYVYH